MTHRFSLFDIFFNKILFEFVRQQGAVRIQEEVGEQDGGELEMTSPGVGLRLVVLVRVRVSVGEVVVVVVVGRTAEGVGAARGAQLRAVRAAPSALRPAQASAYYLLESESEIF